MIRSLIQLRLLILPAVLVMGAGRLSGQDESATRLRTALRRIVPPLLETYAVPGAAVAVVVDGQIAVVETFGRKDARRSEPVGDRTVFQAASLSKPVFTYGVMQLVETGRLDLDRPLTEYVDTTWVGDPRIHALTARHVLAHATGFPNWRPGRSTDNPGELAFLFDPGERFRYSGEGFMYLQYVVETIVGVSLDEYLERVVLRPLGMRNSGFVWTDAFEADHASPHDAIGTPRDKRRPTAAMAAGTLQTTARDYAHFLEALLGGSALDSVPLAPETLQQMLTPHSTVGPGLRWALGVGSEPDRDVFWQWGDDGPFKAMMAVSPSRGLGVVVLTNGQWGLDVARPVVELVLGSDLRWLDFRMVNYRR